LLQVPSSRGTPDSRILFGAPASMPVPSVAHMMFAKMSAANGSFYNDAIMQERINEGQNKGV
jgi:hypothetical protein